MHVPTSESTGTSYKFQRKDGLESSVHVAVDCVDRGTSTVILILHGLNGGSDEEYVKDMARNSKSSVCVMIGRGLMGTPVTDGGMFNGARVVDVGVVAGAIKETVGGGCKVVAVGYSMGGIVLANYVSRAGGEVKVDGAVIVGGGIWMMANKVR